MAARQGSQQSQGGAPVAPPAPSTQLLTGGTGGLGLLTARWLARARSPDIPLSDPRLAATSSVEQVHLTGGSPDRAMVTYVTNTSEPTAVKFRPAEGAADGWLTASGPPGQVYSFSQDPRFPATEGGCMGPLNYTNPDCFYSAPPSLRSPTPPAKPR